MLNKAIEPLRTVQATNLASLGKSKLAFKRVPHVLACAVL